MEVRSAGKRWLITERDRQWLAWMGRWRFVTAPLIEREFTARGLSAPLKTVERRLRGLDTLGQVAWERPYARLPRLYWLTREGMSLVGLTGAVSKPRHITFEHDLLVMDVAHWLATVRVPSHTLVTERELRRTEWSLAGEEPSRLSIPQPEKGPDAVAWPDLVSINKAGRAFGHEVEYTIKQEHRRLVRLMLGYVESPRFAGAVYYTVAATHRSVTRAADEANRIADERHGRRPIHVQPWPAPQAVQAVLPFAVPEPVEEGTRA